MKRIFVYEHLTGGGEPASRRDTALRAMGRGDTALRAMGREMRDAVAADLLALGVYDVTVADSEAEPETRRDADADTARDALADAGPDADTDGLAPADLATPDPDPDPDPADAANAARPARPGARRVAPRPGESAVDFVARQADVHALVWVIAPESGGVLAQLNRVVDPARWVGCDAAAIALATGKRATLLRLAEAGLTTPLAFEHAAEITRWVVKPDDGAGAAGTQVHASLDAALADWSARSHAGSPMAIEPWVEGPALSLSLLCRQGGCELLSINRQQVQVSDSGRVAYLGVELGAVPIERERTRRRPSGPNANALRVFADRAVRAIPGLGGFVGIDFVWHAQRGPVAIEVNPRVTCAYAGLSQRLGRNLGAAAIAACGATGGTARRDD